MTLGITTLCHYAECNYAECHYAECHYNECHYDECHYAECHYAECRILFIVILNSVTPSVIVECRGAIITGILCSKNACDS